MKKSQPYIFKILVIDDSKFILNKIVEELSQREDFNIITYQNSLEALDKLEELHPDIIISDYDIPQLDGFKLCQAVRGHPDLKHIPFIILSGAINDDSRAQAMQIGVTELFTKPFKNNELLKYVSTLVDQLTNFYTNYLLIVDDSRTVRELLKQILSNKKYKIFEAYDIDSAKIILDKSPIDLIILDNILPGMSGIEWCVELRELDDYKWLPILGISSNNNLALNFIEAGADDYISKPFFAEEVTIRVNNQLKRYNLSMQLKQSLNKEKALNRQKNKLLGIAAHDLRNPLSIISEYAKLIDTDYSDRTLVNKAVSVITNNARNSLQLLNDILDVSTIESGIFELNKQNIAIDTLIKERIELINEISKKKNIKAKYIEKISNKKKLIIRADKICLNQIFDNLFSNAVKFSLPGNNFEALVKDHEEGLLVEVKDYGLGIPQSEIKGIFDEFKRTSVKATAGEKSTGLGLTIAKKLVTMHGGKIWVESEVEKGTTFFIIFMC